jgi:hypothetical protein
MVRHPARHPRSHRLTTSKSSSSTLDVTRRHGLDIDTHQWVYDNPDMGDRVKRTYNLSETTLRRVRELAGEYGAAASQDAVVELAVDRLYAQMREQQEAAAWAAAARDPEFRAEMAAVATEMGDSEPWPR